MLQTKTSKERGNNSITKDRSKLMVTTNAYFVCVAQLLAQAIGGMETNIWDQQFFKLTDGSMIAEMRKKMKG